MRGRRCLLALLGSVALARGGIAQNEKIFHNVGLITASVRDTANGVDRLYFMQPQSFRAGYGRTLGFRGVFQDQNNMTGESVRLAFVRYANDNVRPGSVITEATYQLPSGRTGVRSYLLTFSLPAPVTLPTHSGIRATLPPTNSWPTDGITIHYQDGNQTRITVQKPQWTWRLVNNVVMTFLPVGSTMYLGGLYEEGVQRFFVRSNAYGGTRDLFGAESPFPDTTRGDVFGLSLSHAGFKGKLAIPVLAIGYGTPLPLPFGTFLLNPLFLFVLPPVTLDAKGDAKTGTFPLLPGITLAMQTMFVDPATMAIRLSDASRLKAK